MYTLNIPMGTWTDAGGNERTQWQRIGRVNETKTGLMLSLDPMILAVLKTALIGDTERGKVLRQTFPELLEWNGSAMLFEIAQQQDRPARTTRTRPAQSETKDDGSTRPEETEDELPF